MEFEVETVPSCAALMKLVSDFSHDNFLVFFDTSDISRAVHLYFNASQLHFGVKGVRLVRIAMTAEGTGETEDCLICETKEQCPLFVFFPNIFQGRTLESIAQSARECRKSRCQSIRGLSAWIKRDLLRVAAFTVENRCDFDVSLFLLDFSERLLFREAIPKGGQSPSISQLQIGDIIALRRADSMALIGYHLLTGLESEMTGGFATKKDSLTKFEKCSVILSEQSLQEFTQSEWLRHVQFKLAIQSQLLPHYTPQGFSAANDSDGKLTISDSLLQKILKHRRKLLVQSKKEGSKHSVIFEEQNRGAVFNQETAEMFDLPLSADLEQQILEELRGMLEDWLRKSATNVAAKLEETSVYGIRRYSEGAVIRPHVDVCDSLVMGAIIHVSHSDDGCQWPLFFKDHSGNRVSFEVEGERARKMIIHYKDADFVLERIAQPPQ